MNDVYDKFWVRSIKQLAFVHRIPKFSVCISFFSRPYWRSCLCYRLLLRPSSVCRLSSV